jgi:diguanylate cyclase (GGDEF)-like protein
MTSLRPDELLHHTHALTQIVLQTKGKTAVCQRLVGAIAPLLGAEQGSIFLYRPKHQDLTVEATHGYPVVLVETIRIHPGEPVIGRVFAEGTPLIVQDAATHRPDRPRRRRYRSTSFLCMPIIGGGERLGVVSLTDRSGGEPFGADDLSAFQALTAPVAFALVREQLATQLDELSREVMTDALTGAFSHRYFMTHAEQDFQRARRAGSPLSLLMLDVDNFKQINDSLGHPAGDAVLRRVASILRQTVRGSDICARVGGEEFAVLMPGIGMASAEQIGERVRERIAHQLHPVSISVGVAELTPDGSFKDLVQRADQALYQAKTEGKNCVRVWMPQNRRH